MCKMSTCSVYTSPILGFCLGLVRVRVRVSVSVSVSYRLDVFGLYDLLKLKRRSNSAARAYGARNPFLSIIAISPAGTGSHKAGYSHYDVIRDWPRPALRSYGRLTAFNI